MLFAALPAPAVAQVGPPVVPPPPPDPSLPPMIALDPPVPCVDRPVTILAIVPNCDSCHVVYVDRQASRIDIASLGRYHDGYGYPPCAPDTIRMPLGWLPMGLHSVIVVLRNFHDDGNGLLDTTETRLDVRLVVHDACADSAGGLPGTAVLVGRQDFMAGSVPFACAGQPVPVLVAGTLPGPCWGVRKVELLPSPATVIAPPTLRIWLNDISPCVRMVCPLVPTPWNVDTLLPALPAGDYRLRVQLAYGSCFETTTPDSVRDTLVAFQVRADCPPGAMLPYVDHIQVGTPPCEGCPPEVCPGQPFTVTLSGTVPDNCVVFRGAVVLPSLEMNPIGSPPNIRVRFAVNDCLGMPCVLQPQSWSVTLPFERWMWEPGRAFLRFESTTESMCDSTRVLSRVGIVRPARRGDDCLAPPQPCLSHAWFREAPGPCNATFVNDTASADLRIATPVALKNLSGVLHAQRGLEIRDLRPTGPAAGMQLWWTKTPRGAQFHLWSPNDAPIPPYPQAPNDTAFDFVSVLHVEVKAVPYPTIPEEPPLTVFALQADSLLGTNSLGDHVIMCPILCPAYSPAPCGPVARFCRPGICDANLDGHGDVADLVFMVRCLAAGSACTVPVSRVDCDADGRFTIDDVMCCAMAILRGGPHGGEGRPEPTVALGFGEPARDGDELQVPFTLTGADRVGAARVALRFPSGRYEVEALEAIGNPPGWLVLHTVQDGEVVLGLVALEAVPAGATLPLSLRLRLRAGAAHGGEVVAQDADVSGADGVTVQTAITGSGAIIDPSAPVALSAPRPNPAPGTARFTLSLPQAADVDLAVHDLAGRRVATLHLGPLAAGVHPFAWDGRTDHGETARDGVYFVRLRTGGTEVARKTVLMRGH